MLPFPFSEFRRLTRGAMANTDRDYQDEDIVYFLKEELERISHQFPRQGGASVLTEAQAFAVWFLHQETGLVPYPVDDFRAFRL
jgi:hypothetical protein